ncbi:MAG: zinc-binding dehydrogenase [Chloroherpetonaceae bacterium]|nr:zinc-binding dehydrogenase [Chthonomonadaceae bacterium]MDW8207222.1 zinc-binding dehydrogenase [Chloroherpetonaceae bacterium]
MSALENYKAARHPVPGTMLRWHLYGAGLENLGRDGRPEEVEVPQYGPNELLVRQDACGLCFSDTKVIALGANHPRLTGRDLARDPVVLGHEVAVTVVGVGENLRDRFKVGDRFVVQADVFYQGVSMAYGYVIPGGLAEYSVIPQEIIEGDEGCYLLPVRPETGYVESALTEPWACVVSAYAQAHREGIKPGGRMLVIAPDSDSDLRTLIQPGCAPAVVVEWYVQERLHQQLLQLQSQCGFRLERLENVDVTAWQAEQFTPEQRFDDILILGAVAPEIIEGVSRALANHGIVNLTGTPPLPRKLSLDIGRIHYNWHHYLGTPSSNPVDAYRETRTADLLPGGVAWFIGAGGPMGQMHVQRAVQHAAPPRKIVCTDVDAARLQSVADRFGRLAQERGIALHTLNPAETGPEPFDAALYRLSDGRGFDDIVSMVPVPAVNEQAAGYLAPGGWFNIFAGVARGTLCLLDVNRIVRERVRFIGSSGSSLADMRETLERVERGELSTNASLAAIGGMEAAAEGLRAVKEGRFPGKTLIFPHIHNLPLTPLPELKERFPTVYARLQDGQFWTREAEEELLRLLLDPA